MFPQTQINQPAISSYSPYTPLFAELARVMCIMKRTQIEPPRYMIFVTSRFMTLFPYLLRDFNLYLVEQGLPIANISILPTVEDAKAMMMPDNWPPYKYDRVLWLRRNARDLGYVYL